MKKNKIHKKKHIYFDSNDEMYYEDELSDQDLILNNKNFTKVQINPSEGEKK